MLILFKLEYNKNEIEIIMNKTINDKIIYTGTVYDIDSYYLNYISEVIVNGIPANMNNYIDLLNNGLNNIIIKFNAQLITCERMFYNLSNIISIDTSNFFSSNVEITRKMFMLCTSLISLNLNNFNTSSTTDMIYMFSECYSLVSLNLNNFNTSFVVNMMNMFESCWSLASLNINNFDTSSVTNMS